MAKKKFV